MQVFLVRHAIAAPCEAGFLDDGARELTPEGIKKMRRHTAALVVLGVKLDEVWTSPLVRARQTAEILAAGLQPAPPVRVLTALEPGGDFEALRLRLSQHKQLTSVALVGHEPFLGEFTSFLMCNERSLMFKFKKGGVAMVEIEDFTPPLRGELFWLLAPKQLDRIGRS